MHLFFSVGEPSGDQHAAALMNELRRRHPEARFSGFGGPAMRQAGCEQLYPLTELAVMGLAEVVPLVYKFYRLVQQADEFLRRERPDAVVLVDFPGFNWHIARKAKAAGIKVIYYLPPQLWAWAPWRIRKVRKYVDVVLSALPFEAEWYRQHGIEVVEVPHPFFDEVASHQLDEEFCRQMKGDHPTVALLPGSRRKEVERNFVVMLDVVRRLQDRHPEARFEVACYREAQRDYCQDLLERIGPDLPVWLHVGRTPEIIASATCTLMVSGSVSLEVLARRLPAVVMYRGSWRMWALGHLLIGCKYMTLPNLIARREMLPEFPFWTHLDRHAADISAILDDWLSDDLSRHSIVMAMEATARRVVKTGGVGRTADVVEEAIGRRSLRAAA